MPSLGQFDLELCLYSCSFRNLFFPPLLMTISGLELITPHKLESLIIPHHLFSLSLLTEMLFSSAICYPV